MATTSPRAVHAETTGTSPRTTKIVSLDSIDVKTPVSPGPPRSAIRLPMQCDTAALHRILHGALPPLPAPSLGDRATATEQELESKPAPQPRMVGLAEDSWTTMPGQELFVAVAQAEVSQAYGVRDFYAEEACDRGVTITPTLLQGVPLTALPDLLGLDSECLPRMPSPLFFPSLSSDMMRSDGLGESEDEDPDAASDIEERDQNRLDEYAVWQRHRSRWQRALVLASPTEWSSDEDESGVENADEDHYVLL